MQAVYVKYCEQFIHIMDNITKHNDNIA